MCYIFLPVFNSLGDVFCVQQNLYVRQEKLSCQPCVSYLCKQYAIPSAFAVHGIFRYFWASLLVLSIRTQLVDGRVKPTKSGLVIGLLIKRHRCL